MSQTRQISQTVADAVNRAVLESRKKLSQAPDGQSDEVVEEPLAVPPGLNLPPSYLFFPSHVTLPSSFSTVYG